ncbi:hypothetical protein POM88_025552 [Heracleum sosnowskyi]|uniref:Uncharacterized protein n=1 Tax=Heracleum sosnowskyi TaxID=360622 RepID=A0AAD8I6J6_9APIA|nr:hypothetical protein POM88_025552 [Heracleum sosnowskyi]
MVPGCLSVYVHSPGSIRRRGRFNLLDSVRKDKYNLRDIFKQLGGREVSDLETIWFHPTRPATEFWGSQCAKHVNYHLGFAIPDYFRTVYDLALPFFDGKELDIRKILQEAGFNVGEYHSIKDFQMVLKKALGVDVHLIFKLYQGHPILDEIGIMFDMSGNLINHPSAAQVPEGKFLFHTTPM